MESAYVRIKKHIIRTLYESQQKPRPRRQHETYWYVVFMIRGMYIPGSIRRHIICRYLVDLLLWRRLEYDLLAFVPCFLRYHFLLHPGMFIFFVYLSLCSSYLLLSASTYFIMRCAKPFIFWFSTEKRGSSLGVMRGV